jgi:hypothetical protein
MGKKGKATKCMFLPKTSGLGIRWRFSMYLQSYGPDPHFQLQKRLGARFFQFSFWSVILYQMPIHEKKECPNQIITSSNMGITNLVKETLPPTPYIKPPFAFPTPKEKHKCISASARMEKKIKMKNEKLCVRTDGTSVRADSAGRVHKDRNFYFYFFPRPHGCTHTFVRTRLESAQTGKKKIYLFFPCPRRRAPHSHGRTFTARGRGKNPSVDKTVRRG